MKRRERERTAGDLAQVRVAQEGLPEERTFMQDPKDGRRQADRVVIFLPTPALLESPLCGPCILPQNRRFRCPHPCPRPGL